LREACHQALTIPRQACVAFAGQHSWEASARAFVAHMALLAPAAASDGVDFVPEPPRCVA